jgi:hypothetical protein
LGRRHWGVVQLVERRSLKPLVVSSTLTSPSIQVSQSNGKTRAFEALRCGFESYDLIQFGAKAYVVLRSWPASLDPKFEGRDCHPP